MANGSTLRTYDFATQILGGGAFPISGLSKVRGVDFDDVTGDLLAVNSNERLDLVFDDDEDESTSARTGSASPDSDCAVVGDRGRG